MSQSTFSDASLQEQTVCCRVAIYCGRSVSGASNQFFSFLLFYLLLLNVFLSYNALLLIFPCKLKLERTSDLYVDCLDACKSVRLL